jgi:hypothetical protein
MKAPMTLVGVASSLLLPCVANAATVTFSGVITNSCTLTLNTPGRLASTSASGTQFHSESGGTALVAVVATGLSPSVTVNAPTFTAPAASASSVAEIKYSSLTSGVHDYASSGSSYNMVGLLDTLSIDARLTNPAGFTAGNYSVSTVVTCN